MKTGSQAIKDDAGDTYKFYFATKGTNKGAGITGNQHLHWYFNFTGCIVETVPKSLRLSCGSELTRQGISLP